MADNVLIESTTREIPAATRIENVRWRNSYQWGNDHYLSRDAVQSLNDHGITILADLEGVTQEFLESLKGIGDVSAGRLMKAAKLAKVQVVGFGWPGDIRVAIPFEIVQSAREVVASESEAQRIVEEAAAALLKEKLSTALQDTLDERKKERIEGLRAELERLQAELDGYEEEEEENAEQTDKVWPSEG